MKLETEIDRTRRGNESWVLSESQTDTVPSSPSPHSESVLCELFWCLNISCYQLSPAPGRIQLPSALPHYWNVNPSSLCPLLKQDDLLAPVHAGCVLSCFSQLFATPWTVAHQAPLSTGILQARTLEWLAMPSSRTSSRPRDQTRVSYVSCIDRRVLYH